jgi:hypothetical protein
VYLFFLSFSFFFLGPCILARHFVFTWIVQTLIIVYMDSVYGLVFMTMCMDVWIWLCVSGCMDVFLAMCMDIGCVCGYVYGYVWMYFWLCVYGWMYGCMAMCMDVGCVCGYVFLDMGIDPPRGLVHGYWVLDPCEARFINIGAYLSLRPVSINPLGLTLPRGPFHSFTRPISIILGLTPPRGPFPQSLGLTPSRGPFE